MSEKLIRGFSLVGLLAFGLNVMIGSGIFYLPGEAIAIMGPAAIIAVLLAILVATLLAFCFAELSSQFDNTGGPIVYANESMGPTVAFGVGWVGYLSRVSSNAALVVIFANAANSVFPALAGREQVTISVFLAFLLLLNLSKVTFNAKLMNVILVLKMIPLLLFIGWGVFLIEPQNYTPFSPEGFAPLSQTVLVVFYAIVGFEMMTVIAGETQRPRQIIPKALIAVVLLSGFLLLALVVVLVGAYPQSASSANPVADAASALMGPFGSIITVGILLSVIGVNLSCAFATPRYLFAMSSEGFLPKVLSRTSKETKAPYVAIFLSFAFIYVLALGKGYVALAVLAVISRLIQYMVSCVALLLLRRRKREEEIPYRVPGGGYMAVLAIAICFWLFISANPTDIVWTICALIAGYAIYYLNKVIPIQKSNNADG